MIMVLGVMLTLKGCWIYVEVGFAAPKSLLQRQVKLCQWIELTERQILRL